MGSLWALLTSYHTSMDYITNRGDWMTSCNNRDIHLLKPFTGHTWFVHEQNPEAMNKMLYACMKKHMKISRSALHFNERLSYDRWIGSKIVSSG
jgi:hypothetical protein